MGEFGRKFKILFLNWPETLTNLCFVYSTHIPSGNNCDKNIMIVNINNSIQMICIALFTIFISLKQFYRKCMSPNYSFLSEVTL